MPNPTHLPAYATPEFIQWLRRTVARAVAHVMELESHHAAVTPDPFLTCTVERRNAPDADR